MFKHFLIITIRSIGKSKIYTIINIVGLSLGLTCALIIALWVKYELSFDNFHSNQKDLYKAAFCYEPQDFHGDILPPPLAQHLKDNFPDVKNTSIYFSQSNRKIVYAKNGFLTNGAYVDSTFFSMFTFPFVIGSPSEAFTKPNSIVITQALAEKVFGEKNPIGEMVELDINGLQQFIISGVLKENPKNSVLQFEFLLPFKLISEYVNSWDYKMANTYVQLENGKDYSEFNTKIEGVISEFKPDWNNQLYITPLSRCHLHNLQGGGRIQYVYIFSIVAILILIIATFNFVNLTMARSDKRIREIGVKKILGSRKRMLILQFLYEAQLLSFIALVLSIVLIEFSLPNLNNLLNINLHLNYTVFTIPILLGFAIIAGLISGVYPAFFLSSMRPIDIMKKNIQPFNLWNRKGSYKNHSQKISFRSVLVVFQFSLTIIFISGIIIVRQQLQYLQEKDLGYDKENVLVMHMQGNFLNQYEIVKNELLQMPEITNIASSKGHLTNWIASSTPDWEGKESDIIFDMGLNSVDYDFDKTLGIELAEGRFLSKEFARDASYGYVINEAAVKVMGLENPVGKRMSIFNRPGTIIGVIKNMHTESLYAEIRPFVYTYSSVGPYMFIKTNSTSVAQTIKEIRNKVQQIVPDDPATISFLDEDLNELYVSEQTVEKLMEYSSIIAIIISCLGLFGLSFYSSRLRIKEIGIRKVNGAKVPEVLILLNKDFIQWVTIAFIIATPFSWFIMKKWLGSFAYQTNMSWWIFALAGVLALGIALLTVSWQSWRAAIRNPVEALRYE
jgi:putative ABC transport system permease protein